MTTAPTSGGAFRFARDLLDLQGVIDRIFADGLFTLWLFDDL